MLRNKIISMILLLGLSSCVKVFSPKINGSNSNNYVVSGQVIAGKQTQTVTISQTASINDPKYKPVVGCTVSILDNENNSFTLVDVGDGNYSTMIDPKFLVPGHAFKVKIVTPDGDNITSDYDTLTTSPPVDSIYYLRKDVESTVPGASTQGIQFYINFKGNNSNSRHYRWKVYETWEYHSRYPLEWWWDGTMHHVYPPDYSRFICWDTRQIPEIFTISTANLTENIFDGQPLQYVDNTTSRLAYGYSMLVEQLSLSQAAFNYWDKLRITSTQDGGLYEKQPVAVSGNIHDLTHPEKEVLGFFGASSATYKRIFVSNVPGLELHFDSHCATGVLRMGYSEIPTYDYPAYIMAGLGGPVPIELSHECVDCLILGGTNVKPSFWP